MNYGRIFYTDVANGPGCRTALFVSGCTHHCAGCFNEETWDFDYGKPFTTETEDKIIASLQPDYIAGLTILGGEPMEKANQAVILPFLRRVRAECMRTTVWIYSGYTWEELNDADNARCHAETTEEILQLTDVLVDGRFVQDEKDLTLRFRGSRNQRIIDVPASLAAGQAVLTNYMENK